MPYFSPNTGDPLLFKVPQDLSPESGDCWRNLSGYRGDLFFQAVKGADFFQPQQEKKIISPLISLLPPSFISETVQFSEAVA